MMTNVDSITVHIGTIQNTIKAHEISFEQLNQYYLRTQEVLGQVTDFTDQFKDTITILHAHNRLTQPRNLAVEAPAPAHREKKKKKGKNKESQDDERATK